MCCCSPCWLFFVAAPILHLPQLHDLQASVVPSWEFKLNGSINPSTWKHNAISKVWTFQANLKGGLTREEATDHQNHLTRKKFQVNLMDSKWGLSSKTSTHCVCPCTFCWYLLKRLLPSPFYSFWLLEWS